MRTLVRHIGAVLLVAAALWVWFGMAPNAETPNSEELINLAVENDEANNALTDGAPQQSVVNGWTARDLLIILTRQQDEAAAQFADSQDQRPAALLLILVAAAALALTTSSSAIPAQESARVETSVNQQT